MSKKTASPEAKDKVKKLPSSNDGVVDESKKKRKKFDLYLKEDIFQFFKDSENDDDLLKGLSDHIGKMIVDSKMDKYEVVFLYDDNSSITSWHSNYIYTALSKSSREKDVLLIIHSLGGQIEPGYLISKVCKRIAKDKFIVAIPRTAKSAATLIALGADEIHMGLMSQLGPIDPQIGGYPALGLSNSLNVLADLATKFPESSDMFASYLTKNLELKDLGYFERVSESAVQYAERLLGNQKFPNNRSSHDLADHFVNHYKDHGFVIDADEASLLLGKSIIKQDSDEYRFANELYQFLDFLELLFRIFKKKEFDLVGSITDGLRARKLKNP